MMSSEQQRSRSTGMPSRPTLATQRASACPSGARNPVKQAKRLLGQRQITHNSGDLQRKTHLDGTSARIWTRVIVPVFPSFRVLPGMRRSRIGLRNGDVLKSTGGEPVLDLQQLRTPLRNQTYSHSPAPRIGYRPTDQIIEVTILNREKDGSV